MSKSRVIVALLSGTLALVLAAGVAWAATVQCQVGEEMCLGTTEADTITGTSEQDYIRGLGGADLARGMGQDDTVIGGKGKDTVKGLGGPDHLLWGGEAGLLNLGPFTDASDDYTYGGAGADRLFGGYAQGGVDRVFGEDGNDYIETYQRGLAAEYGVIVTKEIVNCGAGQDTVYFDKDKDVVAPNCEDRHPVLPGGEGAPPPEPAASGGTQSTASVHGSPLE